MRRSRPRGSSSAPATRPPAHATTSPARCRASSSEKSKPKSSSPSTKAPPSAPSSPPRAPVCSSLSPASPCPSCSRRLPSFWGCKRDLGEEGPFFRKALPLHPQRLSPLSNPYCRGLPRTEKPSPNTGKAFCYRGKPEAGQNEGSRKAAAFLRFCPRCRVSSGYTSTSGARSERASGSLARRAG